MTRPHKTASDRARELRAKHPEWSLQRIGDACELSKAGVAKALQAKAPGKRGRKPDPAARVERLRRELAEAERELARSRGAP